MYRFLAANLNYRIFLYFFILVAGWPCVFYLLGWIPSYRTNYIVVFVLVSLFASIKSSYKFIPRKILYIIIFQILVWLLYSVIHEDLSYVTRVLILLVTLGLLGLQLSFKNKFEFIETYNFWLVFQTVAGTIGFILVFVGLLSPIYEFIEMDGRPGYFFGLFTTNAFFETYVRNAGFFDEPGSLSFWGVFALIFNKLYINNKKIEFLLIFGLISTLSMAYIIQIAAYFYLFYKKQRRNIVLPTILFVSFLIGLSSLSEDLNRSIFGRFTFDNQTGTLYGDNRSELMLKCWSIFKTSPYTGVGATNLATNFSSKEGFLGANFFFNWASDGIFGVIITYLPLLYLLKLGQQRIQYRYAFIIIFLGYFQRPFSDAILLYPVIQYTLLLFALLDVNGYQFIKVKANNLVV